MFVGVNVNMYAGVYVFRYVYKCGVEMRELGPPPASVCPMFFLTAVV